jgi:hypothetical protein
LVVDLPPIEGAISVGGGRQAQEMWMRGTVVLPRVLRSTFLAAPGWPRRKFQSLIHSSHQGCHSHQSRGSRLQPRPKRACPRSSMIAHCCWHCCTLV